MSSSCLAVIPVLVGPLQILIALLPAILIAVLGVVISLLKPRAVATGCRLLWRLKWQVAVVVVIGVFGTSTLRSLWHDPEGEYTSADRGDESWPLFRGGWTRRGSTPGSAGPNGGGVHWTRLESGEAYFCSPAVVGNRVYATSASASQVLSDEGAIYCLDAGTGAIVWRTRPDGYRSTFSSPSVQGDYLVCGEGLHLTKNARVVCIDLREGPTAGKIRWAFETRSHVECTPVIANGRVYVGAGDDGYYCLELEPDASGAARVVWHAPGERYPDAETSLLVLDDKVWCGLGVGGRAVCVLDAATGKELHRVDTPYPVFSPPAFAKGLVFVGMGNGDYVNDAESAREIRLAEMAEQGANTDELLAAGEQLAPGGALWAFDAKTFEVRWRLDLPATVLGSVAVSSTRECLYAAARDGAIYRVDFEGKVLREWHARAPVVASPALSDELLYVVTTRGRLFGLDPRRLDPVWEIAISTEGLTISSPAVRGDRIFVGTKSDGLLCLGSRVETRKELFWSGESGEAGNGGCLDDSTIVDEGGVEWRWEHGEVSGPLAVLGDDLIAPIASSSGTGEPFVGIVKLYIAPEISSREREVWRFATERRVVSSPAIVGDRVYVSDGQVGEQSRKLFAISKVDGSLLWSLDVDADASGAFRASPAGVVIESSVGDIELYDRDGSRRWRQALGELAAPPTWTESMIVVVLAGTTRFVALDRPTGRLLWESRLDAKPSGCPVVVADRMFVPTQRALECRRLVDGEQVSDWTTDAGAPSGELYDAEDEIVFVNRAGELVLVSKLDGRVRMRLSETKRGVSALGGRSAILFANEVGFARLSLREERSTPDFWIEKEAVGTLATSPVMSGSWIFVGTRDRGVVCLGAAR